MGLKPPPAAHTITWPAWGRPRPHSSSPMDELWGPTVSLRWCVDSHACCSQQETSAPNCMATRGRAVANKGLRISALPVLLLFYPKNHWEGWERAAQAVHTLGELAPCSPPTWATTLVFSRRDVGLGDRV